MTVTKQSIDVDASAHRRDMMNSGRGLRNCLMDRRLAWESDDGLVNSGVVTFKQLGPNKTRVTLEIEHDEERIAEAIASRLAVGLGGATEDLETFKEIIEDQEAEKRI